jgi:hypothetical protein
LIGITIGINREFKALAELSAKLLYESTGLESIILTDKNLKLTRNIHPTALKFHIFDFTDEQELLYFDADWFCLNKWDPITISDQHSLLICKDFISKHDFPNQYLRNKEIIIDDYPSLNNLTARESDKRSDYIREVKRFAHLKSDCNLWVNTGFWIANRSSHLEWLKYSSQLYYGTIGHHPIYYEQPAMNKAIEKLEINIKYLGRKYNTLIINRQHWPNTLIGWHIKIKHHREFLNKIVRNEISTREQILNYFTNA